MIKYMVCLIFLCSLFGCNSFEQESVRKEELVEYTKLTPMDFRERLAQTPIAYLPLGTIE